MFKARMLIIFGLLVPTLCGAEQIKFKTISLSAKVIEFDGKKNCFIATGQPKLQTEEATVSSDKISGFYDAQGKDIERLEIEGNVGIKMKYFGKTDKGEKIQREVEANCKRATMFRREDKVVLTGEAKVNVKSGEEGQMATLKGPKITIFMKENRIISESEEGTELTIQIKSEEE